MFNSASTDCPQQHSLFYTIHVVHVTMIANEESYFVLDVDNEIQRLPTKVKSRHSWSCSKGSHLCVACRSAVTGQNVIRPDLLNGQASLITKYTRVVVVKKSKSHSLRTCPPLILTVNCQKFPPGNS